MRRVKRVVLGIVVVALLLVATIRGLSYQRRHRTFDVPRLAVTLATDTAVLRRGEHLATALGKCGDCHGNDFGGKAFIDDSKLGRFVAPNLTRGKGGLGTTLTDADYAAAIRFGVDPAHHPLLFMPSAEYAALTSADLNALVAYLRRLPNVDRDLGPSHIGPLGHVLYAMHQMPLAAEEIDEARPPLDAMAPSVTIAYGKYLANVGGCTGCHNPSLSGGHVPGTPPTFKDAANLTRAGLPDWTPGDFRRLLREGRTPQGTVVDSFMPYRWTRLMTDDEIDAVWLYLRSLPPKEFGKQ